MQKSGTSTATFTLILGFLNSEILTLTRGQQVVSLPYRFEHYLTPAFSAPDAG
jgi:hypothetical protein